MLGSRLGRPTDPNKIASDLLHSAKVASGNAVPAASMPAQPTGASVMLNRTGNFLSTARSTLIASRITSGPMPSPAKAATLNVLIFDREYEGDFREWKTFSAGRACAI